MEVRGKRVRGVSGSFNEEDGETYAQCKRANKTPPHPNLLAADEEQPDAGL